MTQQDDPTLERAEQALLGALLLNPDGINNVSTILAPTQYANPRHELIHDAIARLHAANTPIDTITVADALGTDLARAGGYSYLSHCVGVAPAPSTAPYYATLIRDAHHTRTINAAAIRIQQAATNHTPHDDVLELLNGARDDIENLLTAHTEPGTLDNHTAIYDAVDELDKPPGIPTPWHHLTSTLAGWKPGSLYIVGARPAVGKSVLGVGVAHDVACRGKTALIYSLEMSRTELYHRLVAKIGTVNMSHIQHRALSTSDWVNIRDAATKISALPINVDDRSALSVAQLRAHIKAQQAKHDVGIVVIDYLQLMTPPAGTPRDDRRVQVDAISRSLKQMAKDLDLPVVALAQLNRGPEGRADKTPTLSDLREAGGQEQDADVVVLMHRDVTGRNDPATKLNLIIAKNRHGPTANIELFFRGEFSRIEETPWNPHSILERDAS